MNVTLYTDAETRLRDAAPELAKALKELYFCTVLTKEHWIAAWRALDKAGVAP